MEWAELKPLTITGAEADTINRRIATHLKFREQIDTGDPAMTKMRTFKKDSAGKTILSFCDTTTSAIRECLQREYFIRRDTALLLKSKGIPDDAKREADAMSLVGKQLKDME
jgi:hypothetical protein